MTVYSLNLFVPSVFLDVRFMLAAERLKLCFLRKTYPAFILIVNTLLVNSLFEYELLYDADKEDLILLSKKLFLMLMVGPIVFVASISVWLLL